MDDFDIAQSKIGESAQRVVDRAVEESRRRDHALLTNEHIFLAFAQVEWDTFSQVMRDLELNPHEILQALEEHLHVLPTFAGRELRVAPATKLVFKLAFHQASRAGRQTIESSDLFSAIFEESQGMTTSRSPTRAASCSPGSRRCCGASPSPRLAPRDARVRSGADGRRAPHRQRLRAPDVTAAQGVRAARDAAAQLRAGADPDAAHRPGLGSDYVGDTKTLDVHVKRLRAKIEPDPTNPVHIVTVRGLGYKFETPTAGALGLSPRSSSRPASGCRSCPWSRWPRWSRWSRSAPRRSAPG